MLPLKNRLKKKKDIERVFKEGRGFKEGFLALRTVRNNLEFSRFAFIVGKKISNKAAVRNRIKRRMREAIRLKLPKPKKGIDGVFIVLSSPKRELFSGKGFGEIKEATDKLLKKSRIFNE